MARIQWTESSVNAIIRCLLRVAPADPIKRPPIIMKQPFYLSLLLFAFVAFGTGAAVAQSTIILSPERASHAATQLNSGTILITGGVNENATLNSALLYDPTTGALTATGNMVSPRSSHTSTLLADGRVLLTGGDQGTGFPVSKSAEIYDPATGQFTQVAHVMTIPRDKHTATLLQDGRVLIVGGKNADLFDPTTQTFTATTNSPSNRSSHAAEMLPDGSVLITGGYVGPSPASDAWIFNPSTNAFTLLSVTMVIPRANHAMTLMFDGNVLVTGGFTGTSPHDEVDIYDPI